MNLAFVLIFIYGNEKFLPNSNRKIAVNLQKENMNLFSENKT